MATNQSTLQFRRLLVVIKQTAYEEYSQLKLQGQAPKALRWKRLESRYKSHKACVDELRNILNHHNVDFSCVNRVDMDRQHLANKDLVVAVGGDGTVLSAAHFLDNGTIPLLGINSDPISLEDKKVKKRSDERRSHGALCMCTSHNMREGVAKVLHGGADLMSQTRINCVVKSTYSETKLVPALNDLLIANPSPAAVSRFRMGWLEDVEQDVVSTTSSSSSSVGHVPNSASSASPTTGHPSFLKGVRSFFGGSDAKVTDESDDALEPLAEQRPPLVNHYGTVTRFGDTTYDVQNSLNVWSSGMWVCTSTGSTAAMAAAGGVKMPLSSPDLQYLIREHMIERGIIADEEKDVEGLNNAMLRRGEHLHLRWNSHRGRIFIDGPHLTHDLDLGDEIMINSNAPPLSLFKERN